MREALEVPLDELGYTPLAKNAEPHNGHGKTLRYTVRSAFFSCVDRFSHAHMEPLTWGPEIVRSDCVEYPFIPFMASWW